MHILCGKCWQERKQIKRWSEMKGNSKLSRLSRLHRFSKWISGGKYLHFSGLSVSEDFFLIMWKTRKNWNCVKENDFGMRSLDPPLFQAIVLSLCLSQTSRMFNWSSFMDLLSRFYPTDPYWTHCAFNADQLNNSSSLSSLSA